MQILPGARGVAALRDGELLQPQACLACKLCRACPELQFYAMVNFCNPGVLGTPAAFRKQYEVPILAGREPHANAQEKELGLERSDQLSCIVNEFILRRTNTILSDHLPPKACRINPLPCLRTGTAP
jgi:SNF2-related domain